MIYDPFSVVVVPFPFTDKLKSKTRPALVISTKKYQEKTGHVSLLMITSAKHSVWFADFLVRDLKMSGLPIESYVRHKIFTVDLRLIEKKIGKLSEKDIKEIKKIFRSCVACA